MNESGFNSILPWERESNQVNIQNQNEYYSGVKSEVKWKCTMLGLQVNYALNKMIIVN